MSCGVPGCRKGGCTTDPKPTTPPTGTGSVAVCKTGSPTMRMGLTAMRGSLEDRVRAGTFTADSRRLVTMYVTQP